MQVTRLRKIYQHLMSWSFTVKPLSITDDMLYNILFLLEGKMHWSWEIMMSKCGSWLEKQNFKLFVY